MSCMPETTTTSVSDSCGSHYFCSDDVILGLIDKLTFLEYELSRYCCVKLYAKDETLDETLVMHQRVSQCEYILIV